MGSLRSALAFGVIGLVAACAKTQAPTPTGDMKHDIRIGQTMPYSGPASAYGTIGKLEIAYFKKVNDEGGIKGRKIHLISLDDGYSPPKAVEQVRKLVEQEEVVAIFQPLGTAPNTAIRTYLNAKRVPQLFVSSGATKWGDPKNFPWTIGFNPSYQLEGQVYAKQILRTSPDAKIAILSQNDDYGKDIVHGIKTGLGELATTMIVAEATYEVSDATINSQIASLKASTANTFINVTTPKFAAQAIRKVHDIGWKVNHYINNVGASKGSVLVPAGLQNAIGLMSAGYIKDTTDERYDNDTDVVKYKAFLATHYPEGDPLDQSNAYAYVASQALVQLLGQCGDDLSRENIMKQATNLKNFAPDLLLPGIAIDTSPTDYFPFDQLVATRFDGKNWVTEGGVIKID
jgi:ABC-type branched-subunit amino acid transport system substrate-binding protein